MRLLCVVSDTDWVRFEITKLDAYDVTRIDEFQGAQERHGVAIRSAGLTLLGLTLAGGAVLFAVSGAPLFATIVLGVVAAMALLGAARWALAYSRSRPPHDATFMADPRVEKSPPPPAGVG